MPAPARTVKAMDRPAASEIPDSAGCYQFHGGDGRVLYVGKAKSLRQRILSYFGPGLHPRTAALMREAFRLEWLTLSDETEALLVEASLIRAHQPPYNVRLRHDHDAYPYIAVTGDDFPRIITYRGPARPKLRRFGPYPGPGAARAVADVAARAWGVRPCTNRTYATAAAAQRPCLLGEIGRCCAPCVGNVSSVDYRKRVDATIELLSGAVGPTRAKLDAEMRAAARSREFERAAALRDRVAALDALVAERTLTVAPSGNLDAIGLAGDDLGWAAQALCVRDGLVTGSPTVIVDRALHQSPAQSDLADVMAVVVTDLYLSADRTPPATIVLPVLPDNAAALEAALFTVSGRRVRLQVPRSGRRAELVATAGANAQGVLRRQRLRRASDADTRRSELSALAAALGLPAAPLRIECFDVSHLGGVGTVAAMSVLEEGLPRPAAYRRWKLDERNDDYASMRAVLTRRLQRLLDEQARPPSDRDRSFATPPGLLLVDGGPEQLAVAVSVCEELGVDVPIASLAKRLEEVFLPDRQAPVRLDLRDPALYVLQRARDEAHRTAITYGRLRRRHAVTDSVLDNVPNLGPARRRRLLSELGGDLRDLTAERLDQMLWLPATVRASVAAACELHAPGTADPREA